MDIETNLGEILRKLRISKQYTQQYVANHLHITRQAYGHYEKGITTPDTKNLTKIASLYGVPITVLIHPINHSEPTLFKEDSGYFTDKQLIHNFSDFLSFHSDPENIKKYHYLNRSEKELLYYFQKLTQKDKKDILLFTYIKTTERFGFQ